MPTLPDPTYPLNRSDAGFSLIEALIALVIFSIALLAALPAVLGGIATQHNLQLRQNVVSMTSGALEKLAALPATANADGCVPLLYGREGEGLQDQVNEPPDGVPMGNMKLVSNPTGCSTPESFSSDTLSALTGALDQTKRVGNVDVRLRTYVGECVLSLAGDGTCRHPDTVDTSNKNRTMFRIIAHAEWEDPGCANSQCTYWTTTLLRSGREPLFRDFTHDPRVTQGAPLTVNDDSFTAHLQMRNLLNILGNDRNGYMAREVYIVDPPEYGWLSGNPLDDTFAYYFVDPFRIGLTDRFTYQLLDFDGQPVQGKTVTVTVNLAAKDTRWVVR